jgi:thioredoxin-dependent peroxiredoxin
VLGASFDSVEDNCAFAQKFSFPYKLICDPERKLGPLYHASDPDDPGYAKRISYLIGPDRKIVKAYPKVVPKEHPAQVFEDVKAAQQA